MSAELDQLTAYGNELLAACVEQVKSKPVTRFGAVNASGRLAREMRVEVTEAGDTLTLRLLAPSYVLTLIFGRQPGKFPNLLAIEEWIEDKGIVPRPDKDGKSISTKSLAYLIGRKIANQGNEVHVQGPPSLLFADLLNTNAVAAEIKARIVPMLVQQLATVLQEAAA